MARIFDASTGTRPTGWALTRSSTATYLNSSGLIATASANAERLEYNASATLLGLLVEPAATNLALQSNDLGSASWLNFVSGSGAVSQTSNSATAPDGTTTAALLTVNRSATGDYAEFYQSPSAASGNYDGSLWVKANGAGDVGKQIAFFLYDGIGVQHIGVTLTAAWQQVSKTATLGGSPQIGFGYVPATGMGGTGLISFLAWGGQLETGAVNTSLVPSTTAAATRAADAYSFTLAASATQLTFTFDDASTQVVTGLTGGSTYNVPTSLTRSHVLYIDDNATGGGGSVSVTLSATESADTASIAASAFTSAALSATEGADTASISAGGALQATLSTTEASDTASISATATHTAALSATEPADTASASVSARTNAALSATEASDTASILAGGANTAALSATEAQDSASVAVGISTTATVSASEASDTATINAGGGTLVTVGATETADTASISVSAAIVATVGATEASDTFAAVAQLITTGNIFVTEPRDTATIYAGGILSLTLTATEAADACLVHASAGPTIPKLPHVLRGRLKGTALLAGSLKRTAELRGLLEE